MDIIRRLAARARQESVPCVDVTERVVAAVRAGSGGGACGTDLLAWAAGFCTVAAAVLAALALSVWDTLSDPLAGILFDLPWGLL